MSEGTTSRTLPKVAVAVPRCGFGARLALLLPVLCLPLGLLADELVYASQGAIQDLVGCSWGEECKSLPVASLNGLPVETPVASSSVTSPDTTALFADSRLVGVLRSREDTTVEYRPFWMEPRKERDSYSSITFLRRPRSSHWQDLVAYEEFFGPDAGTHLEERFGLAWGNDYFHLQSVLRLRRFSLEDPGRLLSEKASTWSLPDWVDVYRDGNRTELSFSWKGRTNPVLYVFRQASDAAVLVAVVDQHEGLLELHAYTAGGRYARYLRRERLQPEDSPGFSLSEYSPDATWGDPVPSDPGWSVDPAVFFQTWGTLFPQWKARFDAGRYAYSTDHTWQDDAGRSYLIRLEDAWAFSSWPASRRPAWSVLEYEDGRLAGVYRYDERWGGTYARPVPPPIPTATPWVRRVIKTDWFDLGAPPMTQILAEEVSRVSLPIFALAALLVLVSVYRRLRARWLRAEEAAYERSQEEELRRQQEEQERLQRRHEECLARLQDLDEFLLEADFDGADRFLKALLAEYPEEESSVLCAQQRVLTARGDANKEHFRALSRDLDELTGKLKDDRRAPPRGPSH